MSTNLKTFILAMSVVIAACNNPGKHELKPEAGNIGQAVIDHTVTIVVEKAGSAQLDQIKRGITQVAALWNETDGTTADFTTFCLENYQADADSRKKLFETLSRNFEAMWGHSDQISVEFNKALHLDWGPLEPVDLVFASYSPMAHFYDDFFKNKIAFITILNFPFYSLAEKSAIAPALTRLEWAYLRMGDIFISRIPASISQQISKISTESDSYISEYYIRMDQLRNEQDEQLFPSNMSLITHWGLRDEIKANYGKPSGLPRQEIIYQVMQRIIHQDIPAKVINNPDMQWNPYSNMVYTDGTWKAMEREPDTRYRQLLNNFRAHRAADSFHPNYPTYIQRAFDQGLELSMDEVELLFAEALGSPVLKETGALISQRLGRPLRPYDIWYDGFKARSAIPAEKLNATTQKLYQNAAAFEKDMPNLLAKLGYNQERAQYIASKITVEGSRGAGHAWPAQMRSQKSRLRTRIPEGGMDYKGYNIAIHEFGHNVEQTVSLYDVDYYMLRSVPNTAFTEALAFIYQSRDLQLLGMKITNSEATYLSTLDKLWSTCEIMGVAMVDMTVWRWMYNNPDATPEQLRLETIRIAKEVWNKWFEPVFGIADEPILAIYSHMISYPLYLAAYPLGHLIEFQIEQQITGKNLALETDRMFKAGRITPQDWMQLAVNEKLSAQHLLQASAEALKALK